MTHQYDWTWPNYGDFTITDPPPSKDRIQVTCIHCGYSYPSWRKWVGDGFAPEEVRIEECPARAD